VLPNQGEAEITIRKQQFVQLDDSLCLERTTLVEMPDEMFAKARPRPHCCD
jgi:hypothetical protein